MIDYRQQAWHDDRRSRAEDPFTRGPVYERRFRGAKLINKSIVNKAVYFLYFNEFYKRVFINQSSISFSFDLSYLPRELTTQPQTRVTKN